MAGIRRLRMTNQRTGEILDMVYWIEGEYIEEALAAVNYFMRDWRADEMMPMHTANLDNLAATHLLLESSEPFELVSGFRTRATNDVLAGRSEQVASNSLHVRGMAADIRLRGRSVAKIAAAARACGAGGVGGYRGSNFVHIDCGRRRSW